MSNLLSHLFTSPTEQSGILTPKTVEPDSKDNQYCIFLLHMQLISCNPSWPQVLCNPVFILLSPPPKYWNKRHFLSHSLCLVVG